MKRLYSVHGAHVQPTESEATLPDGTKVQVTVDAYEVLLTPEDDRNVNGPIKLFLTGKDVAEGKALFKSGARISIAFEGA
jgi:hypothetical protein